MNWLFRNENQVLKETVNKKIESIEAKLSMLPLQYRDDFRINLHGIGDDWSEFMPGMKLKRADLADWIKGTAIKCMVDYEIHMPCHRHPNRETIFMISGYLKDHISGKIIGPGESHTWVENQYHEPHYLNASYALLLFSPPLDLQ